eukprot:SAG31_NODE_369_length_16731_cov_36.453283_7_plen_537_part_00
MLQSLLVLLYMRPSAAGAAAAAAPAANLPPCPAPTFQPPYPPLLSPFTSRPASAVASRAGSSRLRGRKSDDDDDGGGDMRKRRIRRPRENMAASYNQLSRQEIIQWHALLYESTNALGAPGGGSSALRGWAMMVLAMFDAANVIEQRYSSYLSKSATVAPALDRQTALPRVAVARAAQVVLDGLFAPPPSEPQNPLALTRRYAHASQFHIQTAALKREDPGYISGVVLGDAIGIQMLAARADDGHPPSSPTVINGSEWYEYQYDTPYFPGEPQAAGYPQVRPFGVPAFGLEGGDIAWVDAPLDRSSAEFQVQWKETFGYGAADPERNIRTQDTDSTALFHDGNFGSQIGDTIDILSSAKADALLPGDSTSLLRVIALTAMSCNDAHSNHWFWKYHYLLGRPITQYRQVPLEEPGDLGEQRDDMWGGDSYVALKTNQNPEHPSGHSSRTNALTASFRTAFGDEMTFRTISFSQPAAPARVYTSFTQFEDEVMASRTYGGVHWRQSGFAGRDMARRVTKFVWSHWLLPITNASNLSLT